jgi:DNA-binding GntR family transcriptional regulator
MAADGRTATHRLLDFALSNSTDGSNFPYAKGTPLLRLERLRLVDGSPLAVHYSMLNEHRPLRTYKGCPDPHFSLYDFFETRELS